MASLTPDQSSRTPEKPQRRAGGPGIVIARLFGIPVYISPYWFVIAGVFILVYANELASTLHGDTRFIVAAAFVVLLYVSVLIHELSHCVVARGYGLPVRRILLYPLGGFSEIEVEPQTPGREFLVSAAGPALSLVLAACGYGLMHVVPDGTIAGTLVSQLRWANLVVGIFNLLPGLPLDGGRMLRAVIWKLSGRPATSTIIAAWARGVTLGTVLDLADAEIGQTSPGDFVRNAKQVADLCEQLGRLRHLTGVADVALDARDAVLRSVVAGASSVHPSD